ncbi:MAG: DUF1573 domain-containing protein [Pirellulales bacterium]|nr:DUF1573 domain-containing protein [Pirellulales bacterium]
MRAKIFQRMLLAGSGLSSLCCIGFLLQGRVADAPLLEASEASISVGDVEPNTQVDVSYWLTANGPIKILKVVTSCTCTVGEAGKQVLETGERTQLKLKWQVPDSYGHAETTALVSYQDMSSSGREFGLSTTALG